MRYATSGRCESSSVDATIHLEYPQAVHPAHEPTQHGLSCARFADEEKVSHWLAQHPVNAQHVLQYAIEPRDPRATRELRR